MPGELVPDTTATERHSPLHRLHVDAGASFTDFAGWQMPVSYGSDLAEHHAVRTAAGIFDISHMAEISVTGPEFTRLTAIIAPNRPAVAISEPVLSASTLTWWPRARMTSANCSTCA